MTVAVGILALAGCSSLAPDAGAAGRTAEQFHAAVSAGDGQAACSLLTDTARSSVEAASGRPCEQSVADGVPDARSVRSVDAFGQNARVVMDGDTVFLAQIAGRWKVLAAACTPRPDAPYDCTVGG